MFNNRILAFNRQKAEKLKAIELSHFIQLELPPREMILSPWLPSQGLAMIYAPRGIGKTHVSLGIAYAVATGTPFLGWEPPIPRGVLFVDGEMPGNALQERLIAISQNQPPNIRKPLAIITPDLQPYGIPDLASRDGQQAINRFITKDINLVILDNLSTLVRSGKENEAESWVPIQNWALQKRSQGKSILFIHHSGKQGQQRGTSRREDALDTVISLQKPSDYTPEQGASFEVHFDKARGIYGDDVAPFLATLKSDENSHTWDIQLLDDSNYEKAIQLKKEGLKQSDISSELNLHKSTVSKYMRKAKNEGRILE